MGAFRWWCAQDKRYILPNARTMITSLRWSQGQATDIDVRRKNPDHQEGMNRLMANTPVSP